MDFKTIPLKTVTFLKEVRVELKRVTWPTRQETLRYTLIILGVSFAVATFLGLLDFIIGDIINCFFLKGSCSIKNFIPFLK